VSLAQGGTVIVSSGQRPTLPTSSLTSEFRLFVLRLNVITVSTGRVCAVSGKTGCHEQSDDKVYDFGRGWPAAGVGNQLGSFGAYRVLDIRP